MTADAAPPTVLVVDDEPDLEALVLQKFRRQVRANEISFLFAHDGVEALAALEAATSVDLVVSDINMPRMDGLTLLARLQEAEAGPATIIVSAYGDMANIRTAMNRGAFDFLTKPIDFGDLETTIARSIRHVLDAREARRRQTAAEQAQASLSRYFSPNLAARLAGGAGADAFDSQRREVSAIFTDIAGFTNLVESLDASVLAELLNGYLAAMTSVVFTHDGTVMKIVGDAIHALFGAPVEQAEHVSRAVACALALDETAEAFRATWRERGVALGVTRIGVHTGPAIVGNFGGGRFFDYTAYGDTINTAARLEAANKAFGTRICVSEAVARRAEAFRGRPIGDVTLRGKTEALRLFEPLDPARTPEIAGYHEAFAKLETRDGTALAAFAALVGQHADDTLASFHLRRLLNGDTSCHIDLTKH